MAETLSPYRLGKARDTYNLFNVFNALSWQFLTGNLITLFALRMGASSTYIGTISAVLYVSFFFLPVGKILTRRFSMARIFSTAWTARAVGMVPVLFSPVFFASGRQDMALLMLLLGVSLFHMIRGVGTIANNPILNFLSAGPDRGSYITQVQIINSAVGMFAGFIIAMLLGRNPPLFLYALIVAVGIGCGIFGGIIMRKIPGPDREEGVKNKKITEIVREAMSKPDIRIFLFILLIVALVSGVSRTFVVVYCREVFNQSDGMIALYAVFGGLGTLIVGLLIKFLVDRIGAKPIFIICVILGLISIVPVIFFPSSISDNYTTVTLYLTFLFFMLNFGWNGAEGIMQTYFMGLVPAEQMTDMGILYFLGFGIAGVGGSLLSGMLLDAATAISGSPAISFRILFFVLAAITGLALYHMRKLVRLDAMPLMGALGVMFSYRDLKAISLLDKLSKSSDSGEEEALLGALQDVPSRLAIKGLVARIKSPKIAVRMESIQAFDALSSLDDNAERVLMEDVINSTYTTAYRSARTLGNHGVFPAVALLRETVSSSDYMLAGEAMIALAKLGDTAARPQIEKIIMKTKNPRLKIAGVEAIGIYGYNDSLAMLLDILREPNPPPFLRDEVVLAMSSIMDIQSKFYSLLIRFLSNESMAVTLALDEAESAYEYYVSVHGRKPRKKNPALVNIRNQAQAIQGAVSDYMKHSNGSQLCRWILEIPDEIVHTIVQIVLSEVVLDDELSEHTRLQLLIVHWVSHILRLWTNKTKTER